MKRIFKKLLSLTLALVLVTSGIQVAFAASEDSYIKDEVNTDFLIFYGDTPIPKIAKYVGDDEEVTLPERYGSTSIEYRTTLNNLFKDNKKLKKVTVSQVYESVGMSFCEGCTNLESYVLSFRMTYIPQKAFKDCVSLKNVTLGENVTSIATNAFNGCTGLTKADLKGINTLGNAVFENCTSLKEVILPEGMTKIGRECFYNCPNLKGVHIPATVTEIGDDAFGFYKTADNEYEQVKDFTIYGEPGSEAEKYVNDYNKSPYNNYNIKFRMLLDDATVSSIKAQTYTGKEIKPKVTVKYDDKTLKEGKDYTVKYTNNTNAGTAKAVITGINSYAGTKTVNFKINKLSLKNASVSGYKTKTYNGKNQTQSITVKLSGKTLKNGTDYTVSYKNNKWVGKATLTVKGKGKYTGSISKTFTINPKATSVKSVSGGNKKITVKWNNQTSQASGYDIQYSTSSSFKGAKSTWASGGSSKSKTIYNLSKNKKYYVRIRTYKYVGNTKYYSAWSSKKSVKTK